MSEPLPTVLERLIELFNDQLTASGIETQYAAEDLTFGTPEAYDPGTEDPENPSDRNTRLTVTAGEGLEQISYQLHYTRLDLGHLVSLRVAEIDATGATSTHDLLDDLSTYLEAPLTEDDVYDDAIENGVVSLRATAASVGYVGQATLADTAADPEV